MLIHQLRYLFPESMLMMRSNTVEIEQNFQISSMCLVNQDNRNLNIKCKYLRLLHDNAFLIGFFTCVCSVFVGYLKGHKQMHLQLNVNLHLKQVIGSFQQTLICRIPCNFKYTQLNTFQNQSLHLRPKEKPVQIENPNPGE